VSKDGQEKNGGPEPSAPPQGRVEKDLPVGELKREDTRGGGPVLKQKSTAQGRGGEKRRGAPAHGKKKNSFEEQPQQGRKEYGAPLILSAKTRGIKKSRGKKCRGLLTG